MFIAHSASSGVLRVGAKRGALQIPPKHVYKFNSRAAGKLGVHVGIVTSASIVTKNLLILSIYASDLLQDSSSPVGALQKGVWVKRIRFPICLHLGRQKKRKERKKAGMCLCLGLQVCRFGHYPAEIPRSAKPFMSEYSANRNAAPNCRA